MKKNKRTVASWWMAHQHDLLCLDLDLAKKFAASGDPRAFDVDFFLEPPCETEISPEGVALVRIRGPLEHHTAGAGQNWDSYEDVVSRCLVAFMDETVKAVVLDIDSPGGEAAGSIQCHRMLRKMRAQYKKPLYAYSNETMCSAAYAIGSAADEIWVPDSGVSGSIGVIATLFDRRAQNEQMGVVRELVTSGAYKSDGHADRPITDGVRSRMQARVDAFAKVFFECVALARGATPKAIASLEAGVFVGQDGVYVGVADGVLPRDEFLDLVTRSISDPQSAEEAA